MIEKELNALFLDTISKNYCQGIQWSILKDNKIFKGKIGYLNLETKKEIQEDSIYRIWSMTKPIIAIAAIILVQKKLINFDDPIEKYLPSANKLRVLKNNSISSLEALRRSITIKDLLMHTAGFSYNFLDDPIGKEYENKKLFHSESTSLKDEVETILSTPLLFQPGTRWNYSVSIDVLAHIIEIVTSKGIFTFLDENIFKPLNMHDTSFFVDDKQIHKIMSSYIYKHRSNNLNLVKYSYQKIENYSYPESNNQYARGGHGLFSTLDNYMKFAKMLHTGKDVDGNTILNKQHLRLINKNYLDNSFFPLEIKSISDNEFLDYPNDFAPYGWGLGFRVMHDLKKNNNLGSIGEFGWGGAAATYFLVDPKNNLTAVLMTQVLQAHPILKKIFYEFIYKKLL